MRRLREELTEVLSSLGLEALKKILDHYIDKYGEGGLRRLVQEDKNILDHIRETSRGADYDLMSWLNRARRISRFISIDPESHGDMLIRYLEGRGFNLDEKARRWIKRQLYIVKRELEG